MSEPIARFSIMKSPLKESLRQSVDQSGLSQRLSQISYHDLPKLADFPIEGGKDLPDAQFKVVLLACEVERLTNLNYKLVKENEFLRAGGADVTRIKDLENKLGIVLAENEKLNQIIDELAHLGLYQGAEVGVNDA